MTEDVAFASYISTYHPDLEGNEDARVCRPVYAEKHVQHILIENFRNS